LEWLEENQDKPLDEIKAAQEAEDEEGPALKPGEEARSLICNDCGKKFRSQAQAEFHASKSQHVDFSESTEDIAPLTEDQKKQKLQELRERLAAKRAVQSVQDKADDKRNEVSDIPASRCMASLTNSAANPNEGHKRKPRREGGSGEEGKVEGSGSEEEG
jgi:hypothetical protein